MLATPHRWDGYFPLSGHLSVNGGSLVLYLLFGLLGYTLWRVRRQQKLFDILFCQVSRRMPETVTNATHFVEERFWIIGITLIGLFLKFARHFESRAHGRAISLSKAITVCIGLTRRPSISNKSSLCTKKNSML